MEILDFGYIGPLGIGEIAFEKQLDSLNSDNTIRDTDVLSIIERKGLRNVPRSPRIFYNTLCQTLNNNPQICWSEIGEKVGIFNGSDYSNLTECISFDKELEKYGPDLLNPASIPFTAGCSTAGWSAIKTNFKGANFTVYAGQLASLQALETAYLNVYYGGIDLAIIGSTEMNSTYNSLLRKSLNDTEINKLPHSELGISVLIGEEKYKKTYQNSSAKIIKFSSVFKLKSETKIETIKRVYSNLKKECDIDFLILNGATDLNHDLLQDTPIVYLESLLGRNFDNSGGLVSLFLSINVFRGKINSVKLPFKKSTCYAIVSVDYSGAVIGCLVKVKKK